VEKGSTRSSTTIREGKEKVMGFTYIAMELVSNIFTACRTKRPTQRLGLVGLFLIFLVANLQTSFAVSDEEIFTQANVAYSEKRYSDAARDFESLIIRKHLSPEVFYNLGNTYFMNGQVGKAILSYKRALWIAPNDADLKANFRFSRHQAGFPESEDPWWEAWTQTLSLDEWTWIAGICICLLCIWGILRIFSIKATYRVFAFIFILGIIISSAAIFIRLQELNQGVIVAKEASLQIAPFEKSPSNAKLPAGSIVQIQKNRDDYIFVVNEDGKSGWILRDQVEKVTSLPES
jgi:tetratricopeptide (TPR) repeat protein